MTAPEKFSIDFQALIHRAMKDMVPAHQLIMTLEMAKLEISYMQNASIHAQQAHAMAQKMANDAPKIIQPKN